MTCRARQFHLKFHSRSSPNSWANELWEARERTFHRRSIAARCLSSPAIARVSAQRSKELPAAASYQPSEEACQRQTSAASFAGSSSCPFWLSAFESFSQSHCRRKIHLRLFSHPGSILVHAQLFIEHLS